MHFRGRVTDYGQNLLDASVFSTPITLHMHNAHDIFAIIRDIAHQSLALTM
jgi:hypothetical protein